MSPITKEWLQQTIAEYEANRDELPFGLDTNSAIELQAFKLALASLEAEAVHQVLTGDAWVDLSKGAMDSQKRVGAFVRTVYTAPPAPVTTNAEPVAYMWDSDRKDVDAAGYYRPEHKIFAESSVKRYGGKVVALYAAPPAPVSVPNEATPENIEILASTFAPRGVTYQWDKDECNAAADSWNAFRAAMLQGADGNSPVIPDEKGSSLQLRNLIRQRHAEWSQAAFGDVGPVGPLKHLSKEALEAAAEPEDLSEWADMQFLLWDAQRRAGISDVEITAAMGEKLKVNMARQWPEPKDGEPRQHIKAAPQQEA